MGTMRTLWEAVRSYRLAASRIITNYTFSLTKVTTSRASPPDGRMVADRLELRSLLYISRD